MARIGLGFDTGGTYTDAVIMDLDTSEILARSKSLTTRNDLSIGISGAISKFDKDLLKNVSTVSLSSTLATNSIVEGKGCRVGLIC
ncbi:MAG: hydantoinase/oxoprolinase family protein, partial [Candidatus Methanomethylophilaceae archaeon]|nr:hydantoinase/oxoprolinase family protein [Candidatus Methanomethylophilaceae archaeon]